MAIKTLFIGFNWPQNEQYKKLCKLAELSGLTFQMYIISEMTKSANKVEFMKGLPKDEF